MKWTHLCVESSLNIDLIKVSSSPASVVLSYRLTNYLFNFFILLLSWALTSIKLNGAVYNIKSSSEMKSREAVIP